MPATIGLRRIVVMGAAGRDFHNFDADPLRAGHETTHHPGEAVLRMADVVIIAKSNSASTADIQRITETARAIAPAAEIMRGASIEPDKHFDDVWV